MTNPTTRYGHIEPEHQGKELNYKKAAPGEVEHHGGSFRKYMDNKNKKLQEQFDQQSAVAMAYGYASGLAVSNLFSGVSIMVNGFTTPSQSVRMRLQHAHACHVATMHQPPQAHANLLICVLQELKQIMAQHGGNFEIYYHRGRVTHIICSNLTDAKVKIFQRERYALRRPPECAVFRWNTLVQSRMPCLSLYWLYRDPTPVVRPEWVVDSLKAGVLLPVSKLSLKSMITACHMKNPLHTYYIFADHIYRCISLCKPFDAVLH